MENLIVTTVGKHLSAAISRFWRQYNTLRRAGDGDFGQARVRTILSFCALMYLGYVWTGTTSLGLADQVILMSLLYFLVSISILFANIARPETAKTRRIMTIMVDTAIITYALTVGGEVGSPVIGGYLWVTIANGLRFGRRYLYISNVITCLGMVTTLLLSDYWQSEIILGVGILVWMLILPAYVSMLLMKLEKALDKANEASRTKSQFLANMSHELRTPLNAIIGYSEMLEEDAVAEGNAQSVGDLKKIQSAGTHLLELINEILDLTKVEAGKMELHMEDFQLLPLLEEVTSTIKPDMQKNNNTLDMCVEDDICYVHADHIKLRQILLNLLGNANKFTSDGKISLRVGARRDHQHAQIFLIIQDTGIGMTEEQLGRLFSPFVQADSSTTRKYGGTGLGLVISKRFCEMMDGALSVTSEPGKGSTFTITLPQKDTSEETPLLQPSMGSR